MNDMKENSFNNEVTETRKLVIKREHSALLIWGIASASIALLIYLMQFFTGDYYWWIWIALPVMTLPIHSVVDKKVDAKYEATNLYRGFEGLRNIHLPDKKVVTRMTIKAMEATLPADKFLRVNKSYLVNSDKIDSFDNNDINIGSMEIAIGISYRDTVLNELLKC